MPTKITAIYDNPKSPEEFEASHPEQIALAKKIPGVQRIESAKVWPKEDGSATPAYRVLDLYFTDYDAASRAVTTGEASAFVAKVFELATGGVRLLFTDVEEA
ncbi:EthD family reductase [Streptomyces sp. NPDC059680]|uniref:EthD family reductase n=1 Tax=Streptomyces sp. NPDC059680 TaxID=3346904 RepID=UPI00367C0C95